MTHVLLTVREISLYLDALGLERNPASDFCHRQCPHLPKPSSQPHSPRKKSYTILSNIHGHRLSVYWVSVKSWSCNHRYYSFSKWIKLKDVWYDSKKKKEFLKISAPLRPGENVRIKSHFSKNVQQSGQAIDLLKTNSFMTLVSIKVVFTAFYLKHMKYTHLQGNISFYS